MVEGHFSIQFPKHIESQRFRRSELCNSSRVHASSVAMYRLKHMSTRWALTRVLDVLATATAALVVLKRFVKSV